MIQNAEEGKALLPAFSFPHVFLGVVFVLFGFYPLAIGELSPQAYVRGGFGFMGLAAIFIGLGMQNLGSRLVVLALILFVLIFNIMTFFTPDSVMCTYT